MVERPEPLPGNVVPWDPDPYYMTERRIPVASVPLGMMGECELRLIRPYLILP